VKLVEPETAPLGKSAKKMFDPKLFLAAVGAGKAIFKFRKNQHVFGAKRRRGQVFYI
jgi:CRP/FNR family cyclic AMP-dependent transcriptional regulator